MHSPPEVSRSALRTHRQRVITFDPRKAKEKDHFRGRLLDGYSAATVSSGRPQRLAQNSWGGGRPGFSLCEKGGTLRHGRRLSTQSIYYLLRIRAKRAGVKRFTPHDLRKTFVNRLLDAGVDVAVVAKMAGHSNIQTAEETFRVWPE